MLGLLLRVSCCNKNLTRLGDLQKQGYLLHTTHLSTTCALPFTTCPSFLHHLSITFHHLFITCPQSVYYLCTTHLSPVHQPSAICLPPIHQSWLLVIFIPWLGKKSSIHLVSSGFIAEWKERWQAQVRHVSATISHAAKPDISAWECKVQPPRGATKCRNMHNSTTTTQVSLIVSWWVSRKTPTYAWASVMQLCLLWLYLKLGNSEKNPRTFRISYLLVRN